MKKFFAWMGRNEGHLSTAVFAGGFIIDNLAYERIDLPWVNTLFAGFLVGAALAIIIAHALHREQPDAAPAKHPWRSFALIAGQFFLGSLLSGCLIFYTRSASLSHSWPFLLLLAVVFIGNEIWGRYRDRFVFQVVLFFFALYAYAVFAVPIAQGAMGSIIFVESGLISVFVFALLLAVLAVVSWKRLKEGLRRILISSGVILILINICYFTGVLPPLPLALRDAGIYHSITHTTAGYEVGAESSSQNLFTPDVVHHVPGTPLYAYSAVFAPVKLTTPIVHNWEKYNDTSRKWESVAKVAFGVSGGREGGYRGYSMITSVTPGAWRVSIEDTSGSVLGSVRFDVEDVNQALVLHTEVK